MELTLLILIVIFTLPFFLVFVGIHWLHYIIFGKSIRTVREDEALWKVLNYRNQSCWELYQKIKSNYKDQLLTFDGQPSLGNLKVILNSFERQGVIEVTTIPTIRNGLELNLPHYRKISGKEPVCKNLPKTKLLTQAV